MTREAAQTVGVSFRRPARYAAPAAASLLLSAWALYLDPVINDQGAALLHAAELIGQGEWLAGLDASGRPSFALITALVAAVTGTPVIYAAHALNAVFHALLAAGFVAAAGAAGNGRTIPWTAAILVLLYPALNGLRPDVTGDAAYWALYVWSLAGYLGWAGREDAGALRTSLVAGAAAVLFGLEMLVFLLIVPAWWWARSGGRLRRVLVLAAGTALVVAYAAWREAWLAAGPADALSDPLAALAGGWHDLSQGVRFAMQGLRNEFLDEYSRDYDDVAFLISMLVLAGAAVLKTLGPVYTVIAAAAVWVPRRAGALMHHWWIVPATVSFLLLLVPALTVLSVTSRDAMTATLTLLVMAPAAMEQLWGSAAPRARRWVLPAAAILLLGTGSCGLDLRTGDEYQKQAGQWLAERAPPGASVFSNSRIVTWYSGLDGFRPHGAYTWQEGMAAVWSGRWREYDYLALVITAADAHREGILLRRIEASPAKRFTGHAGDQVLIFQAPR